MADLFSFENAENLSGIEWAVAGTNYLKNVLQNIAQVNAAKANLKRIQQNAAATLEATEYNIGINRRSAEVQAAERAASYAGSGMRAADFMDVERSAALNFERDVAALREQTRDQVFADIKDAIKAKKEAKKGAVRGSYLSLAGGLIGAYTGNAGVMKAFSDSGNAIGNSLRK